MPHNALEMLTAQARDLVPVHDTGFVSQIQPGRISVNGLSEVARLGDEVQFADGGRGEILQVNKTTVTVTPYGRSEGMALDTPVILLGAPMISPDNSWIGRVIDPFGQPMDGAPLAPGPRKLPLDRPAPPAAARGLLGPRLQTGVSIMDTFLPLAEGQRIGLFAGSGVGKSTLLGRLAKYTPADVAVIALIGERGRELQEFLSRALGPEGMARSVIVAATSDLAPSLRRRAALSAMTIAEHFRDQGAKVLFLADSLTRFAEAHREVAVASGEEANMRGFPPSLTHTLAALCERAGPGTKDQGSITAMLTVLVAGSDMEEPVADILRGLLDGHIVMDRTIAERGRYPAIDVLRSVSRCLPDAASPDENALLTKARVLLGAYDKAEMMIQAGLYERGSDPMVDSAIKVAPKLDEFFANSEYRSIEDNFAILENLLPRL